MTPEAEDAPIDGTNEPQTPQPSWSPLSAREFAARFAAVEVLFEGREGKTYRARDRSRDGREVALQVLLARAGRPLDAIEGFFQDVRTAQSLVSPHLVEIVDVGGLEDGRLFVATELVQGEALSTRLAREGELRVEVALEIARQTLAALSVAHAKSLAHGALEARHLWLAARVPKTVENPDGIHVRLAGFGLATLRASDPIERLEQADGLDPIDGGAATARSVAGDLAAVASLVEAMVGETGKTDPRVHALVARALAVRGGARGENAEQLASVVRASAAKGAKSGLPRWAIAVLSVLGILAASAGFLYLEQRSTNQELELLYAQAGLERAQALRDQDQWCAAKMEELQESIKRRDDQISELGLKLERELAEGAQRSDAGKTREELERIRRELDETKGEREKLAASLVETQNRAKELEREKQRILVESTPGARAARGFDRVLELAKDGKGQDALALVEELAKTDALGPESDRAAQWMREFATAAAELESARDGENPGEALERARRARAAITALDRGFAAEASAWRTGGFDDGGDVDRAAAGEDALRALAANVQAAALELDREHVADWQRLQALAGSSDPDPILRHVARFECKHLDEWTATVAADLERRLAKDGVLDAKKLCDSDVLADWLSAADSGDVPGAADASGAADAPGAGEAGGAPRAAAAPGAPLADWLDARRWYCGDDDGLAASAVLPIPTLAKSEPHAEWRAALRLERGLASSDSAFPLPTGWIAVWRDSDLLRKTTAWYVDELVADTGDDTRRNWEIRRAVYVGDGSTASNAQRVVLARRGNEFTRAGKVILDVKALGGTVRVGNWRADPALMPPAKSWFPSRDEFATFRSELAPGDVPALITSDGTMTRWFSPSLGLVREEAPGVFRMELVYLGPRR
ncbi:MAG: hypothetical protein HZA52_16050 [Planctomycetes bacterium]|nr:hypothetical protein [Planctomycetota bacterium]